MNSYQEDAVRLENIGFSYGTGQNGLPRSLYKNFSFSLPIGSIVAVMGTSGAGKSTFGRLLTKMLKPEQGEISWSSNFKCTSDMVYIDQQPLNSIFPWQTVQRNVEYPLQKLKWSKGDTQERAAYLLSSFRLEHLSETYPRNLSGGELQRLAVARGVSWRPKLVVLDESFTALDRRIKNEVLSTLYSLSVKDQMTVLLITHNLSDVLALANRCVILGSRPVNIISNLEINLAYPRIEGTPDYMAVQDRLIEVLKHGLI
jgi:NitT/TauT family transport system ATP-binding protein